MDGMDVVAWVMMIFIIILAHQGCEREHVGEDPTE